MRYGTYNEKGKKIMRQRGEVIPASLASKIPNLTALEKSGFVEKIVGIEGAEK